MVKLTYNSYWHSMESRLENVAVDEISCVTRRFSWFTRVTKL